MDSERLKHLANIVISNVDKKSVDGEQPVALCNYTDVYYNGRITNSINFMVATATLDQVKRFGLRAGDILLTKDSETADDIAAVALVPDDLLDVVCGYHLAIIRSNQSRIDPMYLFWALCSTIVRRQFAVAATGVTRFGLRYETIGDVKIPVHSLETQRSIANYLDREVSRIDALISAERRLLDLATERLTAAVQPLLLGRLVTRDRGSQVVSPLVPIPEHWAWRRNKTFLREIVDLSQSGDEELLTVSHITGVTPRSEKDVTMFMAESNEGYKRVKRGDLVINTMWAWMGALGIAPCDGIVSPAYGVYRFKDGIVDMEYFDALYRSPAYVTEMTRYSRGVWTSRLRLYPEVFLALKTPFPPLSEQRQIATQVRDLNAETTHLVNRLKHSIDLLIERRQALITAAVMGEIEVSGVVV